MAEQRHACPGQCGRSVGYRTLACRWCWARLPQRHRDAVRVAYARKHVDPRAHQLAVGEAAKWYREQTPRHTMEANRG